jgi:superfamily II DNA or RNA helicase
MERREKLARFASGETEVLCNAMLLTEGFDDPGIDCVVVLRPTKSRALYSQMVGRGTRIAPGKRNLLLLDFLWLHERHTLIRPAHLIASSEDIASDMTALAETKAGGGELELEALASETTAKREEKLREELKRKAKKTARVMDAREFALAMHNMDAAEFEPSMEWEAKPVSQAQTETLAKFGIDGESVSCAGHAGKILDMVIGRSRQGLATPRQVRMLHRFRHPSPWTATFEAASAFLDRRFKR